VRRFLGKRDDVVDDGQIGARAHVLFVDGDHGDYVEALRIAGYRVEVAPTALLALERASSLRPDALIVPLLMPDMSGADLADRIGAGPARTLAVVVLTRTGGGSAREDGAAAAGAAFCRLPCAPSDLVTMVAKQLAARRLLNP
jgi:CheY-like chemotaxis protein